MGGSGFVGSRVCDALRAAGVADVVSVSKSGGGNGGVAVDLSSDACVSALTDAMKGADCVVSCVGVFKPGDDDAMREGNGTYNVRVVDAAAAAKVDRFVYVSVASIVPDALGGAESAPVMAGYFAGKKMTEEAIANAFEDSKVCLVKPSFIFGGDAFSVNPPRVTRAVRRRPRVRPRQRLRQVGGERSPRPNRAHARRAGGGGRRRRRGVRGGVRT